MKVSELEGDELDRWVARAWFGENADRAIKVLESGWGATGYMPSRDWSAGGPIIERETICLNPWLIGVTKAKRYKNELWKAYKGGACCDWNRDVCGDNEASGPTPLIAAMRCYVASKLGDEVPDA